MQIPGATTKTGTTVLQPAVRITIHKQAGAPSPGAATTPISTPGTLTVIAVAPHTTRTRASLQVAELDLWATSIPDKEQVDAAGSFTTPTPMLELLPERTTSTPAKMAPFIATTEIAAVGPLTAATVGNPSKGHSQSCKPNRKCATKAHNETGASTRCAASAGGGCGAAAGGAKKANG